MLMDSDATFILSFTQSWHTHKYIYIYIYIYTLKCINNEALLAKLRIDEHASSPRATEV